MTQCCAHVPSTARFPCRSILLAGSGSACLLAAQLSLPCAPDVCPSAALLACKDSTLHLAFAAANDDDMHRYNLPQQVELAAVWDTSHGSFPQQRDLVVWPRDPATPFFRAAERNEHIDPLTYALLFPTGVAGRQDLPRHHKDFLTPRYQRLTPAQFYTLQLMVRSRDAVLPHGTGMLFQQYILDAFCRMEASRMNWLRQNQDKERSGRPCSRQLCGYATIDVIRSTAAISSGDGEQNMCMRETALLKFDDPVPSNGFAQDSDDCKLP